EAVLDVAEEGRRLEIERRGTFDAIAQFIETQKSTVGFIADGADLDLRGEGLAGVTRGNHTAEVPNDGAPLGTQGARNQHSVAASEAGGHTDGVPRGATPAVDGQRDEIEVEQFAEL